MRTNRCHVSSKARGFTLVELLVVIGIIALLISILLPSLNRARESARRIKCLSNMRQIVMAMNMFAQDNKGLMPIRAAGTNYRLNTAGTAFNNVGVGTADDAYGLANWVSFTRVIDPISGVSGWAAANTAADQNITCSGLAKYLGSKPAKHNSPQNANQIGAQLESVFRCPSDNPEQRPVADANGGKGYRYSYAANDLYMNPIRAWDATNVDAAVLPAAGTPKGQRSDGTFNGKLASIKNSSDKVLLVCQDALTLDDGCFTPAPYNSFWNGKSAGADLLSAKHDNTKAKTTNKSLAAIPAGEYVSDTRGNVVFADGHGDFMTRKDSIRQRSTGNPYRDPTLFDN